MSIAGKKRINDGKDIRMAKREKVEGKDAADDRNLGCESEGEAADDGTQEEEERDLDTKLGELRKLLVNYPRRLRYKDVDYLIRYMKTEEIISLAMTVDEGKTWFPNDYWIVEALGYVPSMEKVNRLMSLMLLYGAEKLEPGDLYILYNNFPKKAFGSMLLHALGSYSEPLPECGYVYVRVELSRATISKLCHVLPWKLFAHVMYEKTALPVFNFSTITGTSVEKENEKEESDETAVFSHFDGTDLKKAAESCEICFGKGKHSGVWGYYCSFWDSVPSGLPVGDSHAIFCRGCERLMLNQIFVRCDYCGSEIGQARPRSIIWSGC